MSTLYIRCLLFVAISLLGGVESYSYARDFTRLEVPGGCGLLLNHFGPYDYRDPNRKDELYLVEKAHFDVEVFRLLNAGRDGRTAPPGGGIDYTLRAFPNHHRALDALSRLVAKEGNLKPRNMTWSSECYFKRAMMFTPDDGAIYHIYGNYLYRRGKAEEAIAAYMKAIDLVPGYVEVHYNLGLLLFKQKRYKESRLHALKAYESGYPLSALKDKLQSIGCWDRNNLNTDKCK